jgi:hypothetical protein
VTACEVSANTQRGQRFGAAETALLYSVITSHDSRAVVHSKEWRGRTRAVGVGTVHSKDTKGLHMANLIAGFGQKQKGHGLELVVTATTPGVKSCSR